MKTHYILSESGEPMPVSNILEWAQWFDRADRTVAYDVIGDSRISTVFLGLDHAWGESAPVLWETMVFGGLLHEEQDRCSGSREQAEAMHKRMVEKARQVQANIQPNHTV